MSKFSLTDIHDESNNLLFRRVLQTLQINETLVGYRHKFTRAHQLVCLGVTVLGCNAQWFRVICGHLERLAWPLYLLHIRRTAGVWITLVQEDRWLTAHNVTRLRKHMTAVICMHDFRSAAVQHLSPLRSQFCHRTQVRQPCTLYTGPSFNGAWGGLKFQLPLTNDDLYTGLFEMTVMVSTTCHTQYTLDSSM